MKKSISRIVLAVLLFVAISSATDFDGGEPRPPFCPPTQPKCLDNSRFKREFPLPLFVAISSATKIRMDGPTPPFCPPTQPKCLPDLHFKGELLFTKKSISRTVLAAPLFVAITSATDFDGGEPTPPFCPPDQPKCLPNFQFKGEFSFMKKSISRIVLAAPLFVETSSGTGVRDGGPTPSFCPPDQPKCL
ncbi:MAG TPA: hypothetical protein VG649_09450, partial [Candidatus Angelobacter sp.]|nr:hypothetical protein [Candidatus Angelobacter sp.]